MNKILRSLILASAAVLAAACIKDAEVTGYLTEDQRGEIADSDPDKVFSSALAGMYTDIQSAVATDMSHNYFGQKSFDYLSSLMGNDMVMTNRFQMSLYHYLLDYYQQQYIPTANRWKEYYGHIANANKIIRLIEPDTEDPVKKAYLAECLTFRGYAYLYLTYLYQHSYYTGADDTKWGKSATYDFSEKPCVPLITEKTEGDQPRSTVKEIHAQIISDLSTAYNLFESIGKVKTANPTDMDGCVAALYLARTYMIMHDWDNALKYAKIVKDNFDILTTEDEILQGFSNLGLKDIVFGCDITTDNTTIYMSWFSQMDVYSEGYAGIGVWRPAFKPFVDRIADDDIRLNWFCCDRSTGFDYQGQRIVLIRDMMAQAPAEYISVKFIGAGRESILNGDGSGWELGDYIYLRSEEAYLMEAEILAHQGKSAEAVQALTDFMKTRQPSYSYTFTDKASLIEEIIYQKRVEFWGEGLEFLDNRRLNIPVDRTDETWGADNNHYPSARNKWEQESKNLLYQIPLSEIENSQVLTPEDQN